MILLGLQPSKEGGMEEKRKKWEKGERAKVINERSRKGR